MKRLKEVRATPKYFISLWLALASLLGLLAGTAFATSPDTIILEDCTNNGVYYESAALSTCYLHQMKFDYKGDSIMGFCADHGKGMGWSLEGHAWNDPQPIEDSTVKIMMAYFYAHSRGIFTDRAHALGVDDLWGSDYTWTMNAWVQAVIWRYKQGTLSDPAAACAEELMYVYNHLTHTNYTSIDDVTVDGISLRDRAQYVLDLGAQGVWGECEVYEYTYAGPGSASHLASDVQGVIIGELTVTRERYQLTVKKVDATNPNKGLAGARFLVQSANGAYSKEIVTGSDGACTLTELEASTYAITELSPPEGYAIDNPGPQYVVLPADGGTTVTVTFTDTPEITSEGSIRKVDADDPTKGLAGAVIKIEGVDNSFVGTYTTGAGGYLEDVPWDTMPIGSYVATEVTPPNGYTASTDPEKVRQEFYWDGKSDVNLVFENDAKVKIELRKVDESDEPIEGAVFNILKDGQIIGSEATDSSGVITVTGITEGLYAFVEVSVPEPFATLQDPVIVYVDQATVDGGGTVSVTAVDHKLPSLTILKRDGQTGEVVPGAVFEVKGIHNGYHTDVTTGPDGTASLTGLPVDSYEVTEVSVPEPWVVAAEPTQTIWLGPGDDQQLIFDNLKQPQLTIIKVDAADSTTPIPGTVFRIEAIDSDYQHDVTTGEDGTVALRVQPGTYKITELSVPAPYYLPDKDADREQTISLNAGDEKEIVFKDHKAPELTIYKEDSIAGAPVEGARFHVTYTSTGEAADAPESYDFGEILTDANGEIKLHEQGQRLYPGEFTITEVAPAPGFQMKEPTTQKVILHGGESRTVTFQNTPLNAIIVEKYDSVTGEALPGCTFQLRFLGGTSGTGGTVIGQKTTGKNGTAIWTGLQSGTYIIEELSSDGSHVIDTPPQTVYLSGEEQEVIQIFFGNSPKGSLLIKKVSSADNSPISDVQFFVTESDGTVVGDGNGYFVTDSAGTILIENIDPGTTLVVRETRAKEGFLLDDTPQTAQIQAGQTVTLEFRNQPKGNLIIHKLSSTDKTPLEGVQFKITYADGSYLADENGHLSSNGLYWTNSEGQIILSNVTGTLVVTEVQSISGYTIDPNTQSQTVVVNPDDTQELWFYNTPVGGIEIIKVNASKTSERIPDTTFEIRRMDDALVDTITTDENGRAFLSLEDGSYYALEVEANPDFTLDDTPHYFEVKDGKVTTLRITNAAKSGILIHKVDTSGEGIYGVKFLLYDENRNPIGEFTSDDEGWVYITADDLPDGANTSGRFYLRELEAAEGYILDEEYKTVYVRPGHTAEIEWVNEAITGQIQIYKYSAGANTVTGDPAGTPLQGAVYEIINERSGRVVDYITTDARGVAASKPLPLTRYKIREVTAPAYYQIDATVHDVTLEYAGQIIKIAAYDKPANLNVTVTKTGNQQLLAGDSMRYDLTVVNNSNVALDNFYLHDRFPTDCATVKTVTTGTYNTRLNYQITYKTNYNDYRVLATNLLSTNNYAFDLSAIPLMQGEVVTDVRLEFGKVPAGFASVVKPTVTIQTSASLANGYQVINRADAGGQYMSQWETGRASWITIIIRLNQPNLPKTGY